MTDRVVLVCGGCNFRDRKLLFSVLDDMEIDALVHGAAQGADQLAGAWAVDRGVPEIIVPAQWEKFGKRAGPTRNGWMIRFVRVTFVVAFPGGTGTENMLEQAARAGISSTRVQTRDFKP